MLTKSILIGALVASLTSALPTIVPRSTPWEVTAYGTGCSPGGCSYGFNITGIEDTISTTTLGPPFDTSCTGIEHVVDTAGAGVLQPCADTTVSSSQTYNATDRTITLLVQHNWVANGARYWVQGHTSFSVDAAKPVAFTITPSEAWAVA